MLVGEALTGILYSLPIICLSISGSWKTPKRAVVLSIPISFLSHSLRSSGRLNTVVLKEEGQGL